MKHKFFVIIFSVILILSVVITYIIANRKSGTVAQIYSSGSLIYEIDLNKSSAPYELPIENGDKRNIILVQDGKISIKEANCPNKLCVKQGSIKNSSYPIVCLPNELIIKIKGFRDSGIPDAISR